MKTRDYNQSKYKTQHLALSSSWSLFRCFSVSHPEVPQFVPAGRSGDPGFLVPVYILGDFYSLLPPCLLIRSSVLDTNSNILSGCIFGQAFWVIWLPIPFVEICMALWGYQLYQGHFPFSPPQSNFSVFLLSPTVQRELFTLLFPEIAEATGMFIAKNMQSIRLKQNILSLGYLLDYQFSLKATLDILLTLAIFFSWIYPWVHVIVFPQVLLHFCVTGQLQLLCCYLFCPPEDKMQFQRPLTQVEKEEKKKKNTLHCLKATVLRHWTLCKSSLCTLL